MQPIIIISTYPNENSAITTIKKALNAKAVACASLTKVRSLYWWNNNIEDSEEYLVLFKTVKDRSEELKRIIKEDHPYKVPEILEVNINDVDRPYFEWLIESVK